MKDIYTLDTFPKINEANRIRLENMIAKQRKGFYYDVIERLSTLHVSKNARYKKEVNIVSICGDQPRLDIRTWDYCNPDFPHMKHGVRLTEEEAEQLLKTLTERKKQKGEIVCQQSQVLQEI